MMKKSQGKERERKKTGRCRWRRWNACVYIPFFPTWTRFDLDNSFHCCGTIQTGKAEPLSLSLCLSSLLFIVHWSIIQLSRVDDRCKNDILASCALEREGEQVSLLLITPAQAKKNLFIVSAISKKEENGSGLHLIGAPSCPLKIYLWNPSKSLGQGR